MTPKKKKQRRNLVSMSADDWGKLPNTIWGWFDNTLGTDDPKPSFEACIKLAREFQIILNRNDNAELERVAALEGRPVDPSKLKDESWAEVEGKIIRKFKDAANHLMAVAEELEQLCGGYVWKNSYGVITLAEIQHDLGLTGAFPKAPTPPSAKRGRPETAWHSVARNIANAVIRTLREAGYRGPISYKYENSPTCVVGAKIINLAYDLHIDTPGLVSAIRKRNRCAGASFAERFLEVSRIMVSEEGVLS